MTIHQQPIVIDPASIVVLGEQRARRVGRPKRGETSEPTGRKSYALSEAAKSAVAMAAERLGVSESSVVEALAIALGRSFTSE